MIIAVKEPRNFINFRLGSRVVTVNERGLWLMLPSTIAVGTIAKRWIFSGLALAEAESGFLGNFKLFRLEPGAFVRAIAKRAMAGPPT